MPSPPLTGASNPLRIATVPTGPGGGALGITFAPGKQHTGGWSGDHARDLGGRHASVCENNADHV